MLQEARSFRNRGNFPKFAWKWKFVFISNLKSYILKLYTITMPAKSQRFSSSQLNTSSLDFNDDDYDKFSADAVFFVLVQERKRIPVKKADIMKVRFCFLESSVNLFGLAK